MFSSVVLALGHRSSSTVLEVLIFPGTYNTLVKEIILMEKFQLQVRLVRRDLFV